LKLIDLCFEFSDVFHQLLVLIFLFIELLHLLFQFFLHVKLCLVCFIRFFPGSLSLSFLPRCIILALVSLGKSFVQLGLLGVG